MSFNKLFSHIYVEETVKEHHKTMEILSRYPKATVIPITTYKEVFNRNQQTFAFQKNSQQLILAKRESDFLYPGTSIAPSFGAKHFFYNTLVLNCLYNCEYCYLQGMFPSAHLVVFVNNEDFLAETEKTLQSTSPMYLCLSYDTDLLALEHLLGYAKQWIEFSRDKELTIELRTKSVAVAPLLKLTPHDNVVLAWTISPESQAKAFEHGVPSTQARIQAVKKAANHGYRTRICIDPVLPIGDWKMAYATLLKELAESLNIDQISELSIGTFRIGKSYFKALKKVQPYSKIVHEQYDESNGVIHYPPKEEEYILNFISEEASRYFPEEKINIHQMQ